MVPKNETVCWERDRLLLEGRILKLNYSKELKTRGVLVAPGGHQFVNPLDRTIGDLTLLFPSTCFLCKSKEKFHPDFKDGISYHLFACLHKPVDPDEPRYFLKFIRDDGAESGGRPPDEHV